MFSIVLFSLPSDSERAQLNDIFSHSLRVSNEMFLNNVLCKWIPFALCLSPSLSHPNIFYSEYSGFRGIPAHYGCNVQSVVHLNTKIFGNVEIST